MSDSTGTKLLDLGRDGQEPIDLPIDEQSHRIRFRIVQPMNVRNWIKPYEFRHERHQMLGRQVVGRIPPDGPTFQVGNAVHGVVCEEVVTTGMNAGHHCYGSAAVHLGDKIRSEISGPIHLIAGHRVSGSSDVGFVADVHKSFGPKQRLGCIMRRRANTGNLLDPNRRDFRWRLRGNRPGATKEPDSAKTARGSNTCYTKLVQETAPALFIRHCSLHCYDSHAFNSRLSSLRKRQSDPSVMIFLGLDVMKPTSFMRKV